MSQFKLNRRHVLRGLGGICVALPFLEVLHGRRAAAQNGTSIKRYVVAFGGCSTGMSGGDKVVPAQEGLLSEQTLTRGLLPLADHAVLDAASIVTGLEIPWGDAGNIPSGGRYRQWHSTSACSMLCGNRSAEPNGDGTANEGLTGQTSDWVMADAIGGPTVDTRPVLTYRVQPAFYRGSNGSTGGRGLMSARLNGGNELQNVQPQFSPQIAFQDLFTGFIPPDPADAAKAQFLLKRRKSVVDLVSEDTDRLIPKLGKEDQRRLERHFDELRALEAKLSKTNLPAGEQCTMLPDPGPDPEIGGAVENGDTGGYQSNAAYSGEEERANVLIDLIHMAFTCDLSRVSSLMFTWAQCFMNMNPLYGHPSDLHEIGHFSIGGGDDGQNGMADGIAWHVGHMARLAAKLRDSTDLDGSSILDNTGMVLLFEGGWGHDPEQNQEGSAHSSENMVALAFGRGGGLNQSGGKHIRADGRHPAEVVNTVMEALGGPSQLGEINGTIDGLVG